MTMIDYYLLEARVSFCVCKNSCHVVQKLPCCLSGSSLSSDIATQVTCIVIAQCSSKFSSSDVVTCFLLSGGLVFLFIFTTPYRGFITCGRSNGWRRAATSRAVKVGWREEIRFSQSKTKQEPSQERPNSCWRKYGWRTSWKWSNWESWRNTKAGQCNAEAKSLGRHLLETLNSASQSLLECSTKLEKNVVLLEECRADSSSIQSLAAGVNYYASTTKASQAAATANHKQLAWDWLSDPREKQPLKETLKSVRYQCECTSKAAYQVVEVSQEILSELKSHKETMTEQTRLLKLIASNQVELSKLMKGTATPQGKGQVQPGTVPAAPTTPAPSGGTGPMPAAHSAPLGVPDSAAPRGSPECLWAVLHTVRSSSGPSDGGTDHRKVLGISTVGCPQLRAERKPQSAHSGIQWARSPKQKGASGICSWPRQRISQRRFANCLRLWSDEGAECPVCSTWMDGASIWSSSSVLLIYNGVEMIWDEWVCLKWERN